MILPSIRNLIFDFGGVLIDIDYNATKQAFVELGIDDKQASYSQSEQSALFDDYEIGKISTQQFVNGLLDHLPSGTSPNAVVTAWNAMIQEVPEYTISLLKALKTKGYRMFMLSNTNALHIEIALRRWEKTSEQMPKDFFEKVYLSHEMGIRKPNPEIFRRVCEEQKLKPEETLFIDDSIQHIEGAEKAGLKTFFLHKNASLQELFS